MSAASWEGGDELQALEAQRGVNDWLVNSHRDGARQCIGKTLWIPACQADNNGLCSAYILKPALCTVVAIGGESGPVWTI